jgi:hypothetical protein
MNSKAFLEGFKSACLRNKVSYDKLIKLAQQMVDHDRNPETPPVPLQTAANMAVGGAVPQLPLEGTPAMAVFNTLNSIGMYGKPLQPRPPFSGY